MRPHRPPSHLNTQLSLVAPRKTASAAQKAAKTAKQGWDTAEANARVAASGAQSDWLLSKARLGAAAAAPEPEPEQEALVRREHLGEHAGRFPRLEGYVEKQQKGAAALWQRRWFVLDGAVLRYHKSSKDPGRGAPALGQVWGHDILSVRAVEGAGKERVFLLEVHREEKPDKPRVFQLRAATEELVSRWVECLDRARRLVAEVGVDKQTLLAAAASSPVGAAGSAARAGQVGLLDRQDYLLKQNPRGLWQKRWFVLAGGQLIYKSGKTAKQSNTIALQTCRSIQMDSSNRCGINLDAGERVYKLRADSEGEAEEWLDLLQRCVV